MLTSCEVIGRQRLEVLGCWTVVIRRQGGAVLTDLWPPMTGWSGGRLGITLGGNWQDS